MKRSDFRVTAMQALAMALFYVGLSQAQAAGGGTERPAIAPDDSWVYDVVTEKQGTTHEGHDQFVVTRVSSDTIFVSINEVGSNRSAREQMFGNDWSRFRSVNGVETVVNRPLAFPLSPGKAWKVEYTEENPHPGRASERLESPYRVTGWEDVTVPRRELSRS